MKIRVPRFLPLLGLLLCVIGARAQDIASFEKKVTVKKLANGLTVMIMERLEAPVFSFYTRVDAGSAQEVQGITGLAHMFEHMAFKGTDRIGTENYPAEKVALAKVEATYAAYQKEDLKEEGRDPNKVAEQENPSQAAVESPDHYVKLNESAEIIQSEGA